MSNIETVVMALTLHIRKILVIDDNPIILKTLSSALKSKGYEVFTAVDGPEAFTVVRQGKPDIILLDIHFPPDAFQSGNTWDAFLIMHWLQQMGGDQAKDIPVIVMSGSEPEKMRDRCLTAGAVEYFQKPVKIPELLETIQKIEQIFHPVMGETWLELVAMSHPDRPRL
jgi:CheY-like chemotaxis protein